MVEKVSVLDLSWCCWMPWENQHRRVGPRNVLLAKLHAVSGLLIRSMMLWL